MNIETKETERIFFRGLFAIVVSIGLAACSTLPSNGPRVDDIEKEAQLAKDFHFALIPATAEVVSAMQAAPQPSLRTVFDDTIPANPAIGPGDVLSVTIFQTGSGLFATSTDGVNTTSVTLPMLTVDSLGRISIPYAGLIRVADRTPLQVGELLEQRLQNKAMQPQVIVTIATNTANAITITGGVKVPGRYPLTAGGETLLQMIATAGGSTAVAADTTIELTRRGQTGSIPMQALIDRPQENIHVMSGDFLHLVSEPHTYMVFGAASKQGEFHIDATGTTLAQAIARAGGLRDAEADSSAVYLFRHEAPQVVAKINAIKKPEGSAIPASVEAAAGPLIYRFDLKSAEGYFLAQNAQMRDKDLVYVPSASSVDWQKFLDLFRLTVSPAVTGAQMNRSF